MAKEPNPSLAPTSMTDTDGDLSISSKIVIVNQKFISSLTIPKLSPPVDKCVSLSALSISSGLTLREPRR